MGLVWTATGSRVVLAALSDRELEELTSEFAVAVQAAPQIAGLAPAANLDHWVDPAGPDGNPVLELLTTTVPQLRAARFEVMLPASVVAPEPTVRLTPGPIRLDADREIKVGHDAISDFHWQLALGDRVLQPDEVAALADGHAKLFAGNGRWYVATDHIVAVAARYVLASGSMALSPSALWATIAGADHQVAVAADDVPAGEAWTWVRDAVAGGAVASPQLPAPGGFAGELRHYQHRGMEWLVAMGRAGLGAVLADDMGLGKTIQVLATLLADRAGPTVLVCPMSVVGNWGSEAARFAPELEVLTHHGAARLRGEAFLRAARASDLVITTFALAVRDRELLQQVSWDRLVVDEAQHIKNVRTAAARALRAIDADRRIALAGTPVENRLEDLRATIDLVNPGLLGSASVFHARFASHIEREQDSHAVERLIRFTAPFVLRREKTDPDIAPELPDKYEQTVRADLTEEQVALYQAAVTAMETELLRGAARRHHDVASQLSPQQRSGAVLKALTRLKQICDHPALLLDRDTDLLDAAGEHRSGKVEAAFDILDSVIDDGECALLFTQYVGFGELLTKWLGDRYQVAVPFLHGGLGRGARDTMVERFQRRQGSPVMILSLRAGGTGLNLTAANHVVHLDRWWNPAVENQATDRAFRIGQSKDVQVRTLMCVGTIEERIDSVLTDKTRLADLTVRAGESWVTSLDDAALLDLMALRSDAVTAADAAAAVSTARDVRQRRAAGDGT